MAHQLLEADRSIRFSARGDVRAAVERIGRAEDLCFSPDGTRLAIAGLAVERLLILDVEARLAESGPQVALTGFVEIECAAFHYPHGLAWADNTTVIVANREGAITIIALPDAASGSRVKVEPLRLIGTDGSELIHSPGSVAAIAVGMGLIELLVCNNFVDHVTRHLLDRRRGYAVIASEILIGEGLAVPDGVAHSPSGRWIALSNHEHHTVLLLRNNAQMGGAREAEGALTGLNYPHGLKFTADERCLLIADAGAPFVRIFTSDTGEWSGRRGPSGEIRVMSDSTFARAHHIPSEGGPKGIDLTLDNALMAISCAHTPLAFFDMRGLIPANDAAASFAERASEAERVRAVLLRALAAAGERVAQESEAVRRAGEQDRSALAESRAELRKAYASWSWKLTLPLRWANGHRTRFAQRAGRRLQKDGGRD
jgi:hypothetical protein